jgi:hypothetical protein
MQNRIDRLEGLVLSLMHGGANIVTPGGASSSSAAPASAPAAEQSTSSSAGPRTGSISSKSYNESTPSTRADGLDEDDDSDVEEGLAQSLGVLKMDSEGGKSMYIGQQHWHAMLIDLAEVKNYFANHKKEFETNYKKVLAASQSKQLGEGSSNGMLYLFNAPPATEVELRGELPPRSSVVMLCGRYFNSMDSSFHFIHSPSFRQQLETHWTDPSKTPLMWLGLLYSIMCLALLSYHKVGDEPAEWKGRCLELAQEYRLRTAQCLVTADYTTAVEHTVETMIHYVYSEHMSRTDSDMSLYLALSLAIRLSFRMGYHRDAKWFPSITPFQAEMRRRSWAILRMLDAAMSYNVSLPAMINAQDCDTQPPTNLFDDEFGPDSTELPPARPANVPTPLAYMIVKTQLCIELGDIVKATTKVGEPVHYDEVLRFDARLREIMSDMPPHLKIVPLANSADPVQLIIARFNIDILYNKLLCVLHKKYLMRARQNPRYSHSRRTAIQASLATLQHMETLYHESQPSGRLRAMHWHFNSLAVKEFGLPAMLLLLELRYAIMTPASTPGSPSSETPGFWTLDQQRAMYARLEMVRDVWKSMADDNNVEAWKSYKILRIMMEALNNPAQLERVAAGLRMGGTSVAGGDMCFDSAASKKPEERSAALGLGMLSGTIPKFSTTSGGLGSEPPFPANVDIGMEETAAAAAAASTSGGDPPSAGGLGVEMPADVFGAAGRAQSPFSMFTQLGAGTGSGGHVNPANIDWVSVRWSLGAWKVD